MFVKRKEMDMVHGRELRLFPPVVAAPTFATRKPAVAVFTLDDYVAADIMTSDQAGAMRDAVPPPRNILVAGGTSTGDADRGAAC